MRKALISVLAITLILSFVSCKEKKAELLKSKVIDINVEVGPSYLKRTAQVAIWIEDLEGNYIETVYVSHKAAYGKWMGNVNPVRSSTLPVWSHKRGVKADNGYYMPTKKMPLADSMTGASPTSSFIKQYPLGGKLTASEYIIKVEVNTSFDYNDHYAKKVSETSPYFHNGASAQPSLVYGGIVKVDRAGKTELTMEGHGHPAGMDGSISADLKGLTTALELINRVLVEIKL